VNVKRVGLHHFGRGPQNVSGGERGTSVGSGGGDKRKNWAKTPPSQKKNPTRKQTNNTKPTTKQLSKGMGTSAQTCGSVKKGQERKEKRGGMGSSTEYITLGCQKVLPGKGSFEIIPQISRSRKVVVQNYRGTALDRSRTLPEGSKSKRKEGVI